MRLNPLLLSLLLPLSAAAAEDFTPAQRQAVIGIMRDALQRDPSILRDALTALQADDARRQDKAASDAIALVGPHLFAPEDPVAGNPLGDVTLVEFYDTRCSYCRAMEPVIGELLRADGQVKLVVKDLPVLGSNSQLESRALLAAQAQGAYFKLRPAVMALAGTTTRASLRDLADHLGFDGARLLRDMDDPAINARLQGNIELARLLGLDGTPAFVVGGRMIAGAADLREMQAAVTGARKR